MPVVVLSANVRLVDFHDLMQFERALLTGFPDTLQHEPGGLLLDPDFFGELVAADALPRRQDGIHGDRPFP